MGDSSEKTPELMKMGPQHYKILDLYLQGNTVGDIATQLDRTREGITWVVASAPFQHELARRRKDLENVHDQTVAATTSRARDLIARSSEMAAQKLVDKMNSQDERIAMMSIIQILDRATGSTNQPVNVQILGAERVQLLLQSINESRGFVPKQEEAA